MLWGEFPASAPTPRTSQGPEGDEQDSIAPDHQGSLGHEASRNADVREDEKQARLRSEGLGFGLRATAIQAKSQSTSTDCPLAKTPGQQRHPYKQDIPGPGGHLSVAQGTGQIAIQVK